MKERFGLYLILTDPAAGYAACAQAAVDTGVRCLQLRMKNAPREAVIQTARILRSMTRDTRTRFIINDDLEIAMEVDADGLHLGQNDQPVTEARRIWNTPGKIFGLSTHTAAQAAAALESSPDYIGVGPVFPTPTKRDADPALGIDQTARIISDAPLPAVAIGGINEANLPRLLDAGIGNFCVVRAVNEAVEPAAAICRLQRIWEEHRF